MRVTLAIAVALLAVTASLSSCSLLPTQAQVTFASDPSGARVIVDNKDSGFVTPCALSIRRSGDTRVDLQMPGYLTATRFLTPDHQAYVILWREMYLGPNTFHFPLWLNIRDFFVPVKYWNTMAPGRIFVRLERSADQPTRVGP